MSQRHYCRSAGHSLPSPALMLRRPKGRLVIVVRVGVEDFYYCSRKITV